MAAVLTYAAAGGGGGGGNNEYAGHSFRIGAAMSAAMAGVEDSTI